MSFAGFLVCARISVCLSPREQYGYGDLKARSIHYLLYCSCNFVSWGGLDYLRLSIRDLIISDIKYKRSYRYKRS